MRIQPSSIFVAFVMALVAPGSAHPHEQPPAARTGSYKGFIVNAVIKAKGESIDVVTVHERGNHLVKVELTFERHASTPTSLSVLPKCSECVEIPIKEFELNAAGTVYPGLLHPALVSHGVRIIFDNKTLTRGKGAFYAEVPADTVCSTLTVRLGESEFTVDQSKFPKNCR